MNYIGFFILGQLTSSACNNLMNFLNKYMGVYVKATGFCRNHMSETTSALTAMTLRVPLKHKRLANSPKHKGHEVSKHIIVKKASMELH